MHDKLASLFDVLKTLIFFIGLLLIVPIIILICLLFIPVAFVVSLILGVIVFIGMVKEIMNEKFFNIVI